jgi:hypothetical protein
MVKEDRHQSVKFDEKMNEGYRAYNSPYDLDLTNQLKK